MKIEKLLAIQTPTPLAELDAEQIAELQKALSIFGYPVGSIDGLIGPKTRNAWAEFKTDVYIGNPDLIGKESIAELQNKLAGKDENGSADFTTKDGTIAAIKKECVYQDIGLNTQIAYVLATTQWETNQTFQPVREAYWLSDDWRKRNLRYYPFYGRGYVQITWKNNYEKYAELLDVDLVSNPDIAMQPEISLFILVHGFKTGIFTGRKITDYIDSSKSDFVAARRCINGTDKAHEIADLARKFLITLQ